MPILYDNYLIVPHKDLHGVFDASAKKKPVAMRHALDLAKKTNKVIVIVRVIEIITPQQAAEQSFAPDASPDTVASVCEHGHIVACPHGCR